MEKAKLEIISIYSESKFVSNFLAQTCQDICLETFPYSSFTSIPPTSESISILDIQNQIVFDKFIKPVLRSHVFYPIILLVPSDLIIISSIPSNLTILLKPLQYKLLLKSINSNKIKFVHKLSNNTFLNTKTSSLIKIFKGYSNEVKLTHLELEILNYLLKIRNNGSKESSSEQEILSDVFGYHALSHTNTLKTHIHRLKRKLGADSPIIQQKKNGYMLCLQDSI